MTDQLSYFAGLFDGEGSISIYEKERFCVLRLSIAMQHEKALLEFAKFFRMKCGQHKARKLFYAQTTGRRVAPIAIALLPHLIVKQRQAELAIQYVNLFCQRFAPRLNAEQRKQRSEMSLQMSILNGTLNWKRKKPSALISAIAATPERIRALDINTRLETITTLFESHDEEE